MIQIATISKIRPAMVHMRIIFYFARWTQPSTSMKSQQTLRLSLISIQQILVSTTLVIPPRVIFHFKWLTKTHILCIVISIIVFFEFTVERNVSNDTSGRELKITLQRNHIQTHFISILNRNLCLIKYVFVLYLSLWSN